MTTYQDQPLSRREIREREAAAARAAEAAPSGAEQSGADQTGGDQSGAEQSANAQPGDPAAPQWTPEPLTYVTQERAPLPQYDAPVAGPNASTPPAHATTPPVGAPVPADAAEEERQAGYRYRDYSPEGRRAARLGWPPASAEPSDLDHRTQNRENTPFIPSAAAVPDASSAPPVVSPTASAQPVMPPPMSQPPAFGGSTSPAFPAPTASTAAPPPAAAVPTPGTVPAASESGMSRRELRAMREAQERATGSAAPVHPTEQSVPVTPTTAAPAFDELLAGRSEPDAPAEQQQAVPHTPPPLIEPEEPRTDAIASLQALFRAQSGALPIVPEPAQPESAQPEAQQPDAQQAVPEQAVPEQATPQSEPEPEPVADEPTRPEPFAWQAPQTPAEQPASVQPVYEQPPSVQPVFEPQSEPQSEPQPVEHVHLAPEPLAWPPAAPSAPPVTASEPVWGLSPGMPTPSPTDDTVILPSAAVTESQSEQQSQAEVPQAQQPEAPASSSQPPVPGERPHNHWSRQAELDDEAQPATGSLSRSVGVGSGTANALVLPEVPNTGMIVSPITSTGDVLVTGSISLPASLASTGALPAQLDESDLDNLLDPGDAQVTPTGSQPVRAIRAVSTHTSSREIIGSIKPKRGNRALTALIIAAAGMAVVVVTLLVVALASGVLG